MTLAHKNVKVALGSAAMPLGELAYARDGRREHSTFAYGATWLNDTATRFAISPDLPLVTGNQFRKAPSRDDSTFHFAFADTEPDGWGCRVIARDRAKCRNATRKDGNTAPAAELNELDYLLGVDDVSRIGAIRLSDPDSGNFLRTMDDTGRGTPPFREGHRRLEDRRKIVCGWHVRSGH